MTISGDDDGNLAIDLSRDGVAKYREGSGRAGRASVTGGDGPGRMPASSGLDEPSPKVLGIRSTSMGNDMTADLGEDADLSCGVGGDGLGSNVFMISAAAAGFCREVDGEVGRSLLTLADVELLAVGLGDWRMGRSGSVSLVVA